MTDQSAGSDAAYGALGLVSADSAIQSAKLYGDAGRMRAKHLQAIGEFAGGPMSVVREAEHLSDYARLAGDGSSRRLFGVPASRLLEMGAPFVERPASEVLAHLRNKLHLGGKHSPNVQNMTDHYRGFGKNPMTTLLRETFADSATATQMFPDRGYDPARAHVYGARRVVNRALRGDVPFDLPSFVQRHDKDKMVATKVGDAFKSFFTNYQNKGKGFSSASAMHRGLGRYAGAAKPVSVIAGGLSLLGLGTSLKHFLGAREASKQPGQ